MRNAGRITLPLIVALSVCLGSFYYGVSVLDTDQIIEPPDSPRGADEVTELTVTLQRYRIENDVVMEPDLSRIFLTFPQSGF